MVLVAAQIASTAATARLVAPREFGAYATAQAAAGFAGYFTMSSIGNGVLRRSQLGPRTIGTAIALSLGSAFTVGVVLVAVASPWARAWGVPDATPVVRAIALTLFLTSVATVPVALIRHRLHFAQAAIVDTGTQVAGLTAGVILAAEYHSALALALGQAVGAGALLVTASILVRDQLCLAFDRPDARELATFSTQVSFLGFGSYATNTAPGWFAGRAFGPSVLGLYSRATLIVGLPLTYLLIGVTKVVYPLYGRVRDDARRIRVLINEGLVLTTGFVWPAFALVAGGAPVIVRVLLGPSWHGAAPLVALSALIACGNVACGFLTNAAEALGWMRIVAARQILFFVGTATALLVAHFAGLSLTWLLALVAFAQWATYGLTLVPFVTMKLLDRGALLRENVTHGTVAMVLFGAAAGCAHGLSGESLAIQVTAQIAVAGGAVLLLWLGRSWVPAMRVLARRLGTAHPEDGMLFRLGAAVLR
jgi:O-antigen/teichoic acid export membrane protein